jgi:hypothetical protein
MRKTALSMIFCAVICTATFAQTERGQRSGFQFGFIYPLSTNGINAIKYTNNVSLNVLAGISQNEKAFTLGGLTNIILRDAAGIQIAGLYNHINNDGKGFLLSGLASYVGHDYTGLQLAGLTNIAGNVKGVQIASLVNIAGNVTGVQLAGLVNVADNSDYPIGLVNLIKNGEKSIAVTYNEIGSFAISFRSGGRVTYGIIGYGYNLKGSKKTYLSEGGLGAHINLASRFRLNNEIRIETHNSSENATFKAGYHLLAAYKIVPHIEVFAGPGINYMYSNDRSNTGIFPRRSLWEKHEAEKWQQVFVGFQLGMQYVF